MSFFMHLLHFILFHRDTFITSLFCFDIILSDIWQVRSSLSQISSPLLSSLKPRNSELKKIGGFYRPWFMPIKQEGSSHTWRGKVSTFLWIWKTENEMPSFALRKMKCFMDETKTTTTFALIVWNFLILCNSSRKHKFRFTELGMSMFVQFYNIN